MKRLIILSILSQSIFGDTINLKSLIESVEQIKLIDKSIEEESLALEAQTQSNRADEPFVLNHSISKIGTSIDNLKNGIDTSISKEIKLGDIQELEIKGDRLNNEAYIIKRAIDKVRLKNDIRLQYHKYCIGESYLNSFQNYYDNLEELYRKKQIAYANDDISKTELFQVEIERDRQKVKLNNIRRKEKNIKEQLFILGGFNIMDNLSCSDLYPIESDIDLTEKLFAISEKSYQKKQNSLHIGVERYSKKLEKVNISIGYNHEIDSDFYTVGVEIPLNFTTKKNEYKKASILHQISALEIEHQRFIQKRYYQVKQLDVELNSVVETIRGIEENIESFKSKLLPLITKSYSYGESTVMEYLLTQQKLNLLQRELLDQKEIYYSKLFTIYTITEQEDIK